MEKKKLTKLLLKLQKLYRPFIELSGEEIDTYYVVLSGIPTERLEDALTNLLTQELKGMPGPRELYLACGGSSVKHSNVHRADSALVADALTWNSQNGRVPVFEKHFKNQRMFFVDINRAVRLKGVIKYRGLDVPRYGLLSDS